MDQETREERVSISLPGPVINWLNTRATSEFVRLQDFVRSQLIQLYLDDTEPGRKIKAPQQAQAPAPTVVALPSGARTRSGYFGVYRYGTRWAAVLRQKRIGVYDTPEEAARVYDAAAQEIGETKLNFETATAAPVSATPALPPATTGSTPTPLRTSVNTSGYRGVYPYGKRWAAYVSIGPKKRARIGVFDTPEEAARAYDATMTARGFVNELNFPAIEDPTRPFIERLARGEQLTREDFINFERASNIYDAAVANKPVQTSLITLEPLVAEEAPKVLQRRDDVKELEEEPRARRGDFDIFDLAIEDDDEPTPRGDSSDST